jgi:hypothetical protein
MIMISEGNGDKASNPCTATPDRQSRALRGAGQGDAYERVRMGTRLGGGRQSRTSLPDKESKEQSANQDRPILRRRERQTERARV